MRVGDALLRELTQYVAEERDGVGIAHIAEGAVGREPYADASLAPHVDRDVDRFHQQPGAVFNRAAVFVGAVIGLVFEELVEQVSVGRVNLNAIKSAGFGVLGALAVVGQDGRQLGDLQCAGRFVRHLPKVGA